MVVWINMLTEKIEIIESTDRLDEGGENEIEEIIFMQSSIWKVTLLTTVEYAGKRQGERMDK